MEKRVYLDNASTTTISASVYRDMLAAFQDVFGNPSSTHSFGREALSALESAREKIAKAIGAKSNEIYFTSGGTESNNLAIKGFARANKDKGNHIIVSSIEHASILEACKDLEKEGFEVTYLPVDKHGVIRYVELVKAISPKTILVSVQTANNEVGTIQPLQAIAEYCRIKKIAFHTDAVQAIGVVPINVSENKIDMMTISGHKIHAPKGVGVLYVKKGLKLCPIISGGGQEKGLRSGTVNVPFAVAMATAVSEAVELTAKTAHALRNVRRYFLRKVKEEIPCVELNGHPRERAAGNANLSFEGIDATALVALLDMAGVAVSTGAACSAGSAKTSHVLLAMGKTEEEARSAVRFTFGIDVTPNEIDYAVKELQKAVKKLRKISPFKIKKDKEDK